MHSLLCCTDNNNNYGNETNDHDQKLVSLLIHCISFASVVLWTRLSSRWRLSIGDYIYRRPTIPLNAQAQPRKPGIWYTRLPKGLPSNFCFLLKEKASRFGYARIENTSVFVECTILVSRDQIAFLRFSICGDASPKDTIRGQLS